MKKITLLIVTIGLILSCNNPDQVGEEDLFCTSGASVLTIDDSNVSTTIKNKIYQPVSGSSIIHINHSDYNSAGRMVIIPVAFSDLSANNRVTSEVIDQVFFSSGTGSIKDYFYENSWGQFNLTKAGASNLVNINRPRDYYTPASVRDYTQNPQLYKDICQLSSINWAEIDRNNDRIITPNEALIVLVFANGGAGACRPNEVSISYNGQTYRIRNRFVIVDCTKSDDPREGIETFFYNYSTMWHELAHGFFGLPDRYGEYAGGGTGGFYDIMDGHYSRMHITVVDKMKIGWIKPKVLLPASQRIQRGLRCYSFSNIESHPSAVVLYSAGAPNECFVIENKSRSGSARDFNSGMPSEGLAIWWTDLNSGAIRLIDASKIASNMRIKPLDYGIPTENGLFQFNTGDNPTTPILLRNQNDQLIFTLRAISPVGTNMQVEL